MDLFEGEQFVFQERFFAAEKGRYRRKPAGSKYLRKLAGVMAVACRKLRMKAVELANPHR